MSVRVTQVVTSLAVVGAVAFGLHFVWEVAQCQLFFVHLQLPPTWSAMLTATGGDVVLTFFAYAVVAAGSSDWQWHLRDQWRRSTWVIIELTALALAVSVERMGLNMGRWAYLPRTPMLPGFGVSVVPVLQLVVLFPTSFVVSARIWRRWDRLTT